MKNITKNDFGIYHESDFENRDIRESEEFFSLGNGKIIQQGNFEELFSEDSISGSYCTGLDKSVFENKIAWKSEYKQDNEMLINSPDWVPIIVRLNDEILDLSKWKVLKYSQVLNIKEAFTERICDVESPQGHVINVRAKRFISFDNSDIAVINYNVRSLNFEGRISLMPMINGNINNQQKKQNELTWNVLQTRTQKNVAHIWTQIRLQDFQTCTAMSYSFFKNNEEIKTIAAKIEKEKAVGFSVGTDVKVGDRLSLYKYVSLINSKDYDRDSLTEKACELSLQSRQKGWNTLFDEHTNAWEKVCNTGEISINAENLNTDESFLGILKCQCKYLHK